MFTIKIFFVKMVILLNFEQKLSILILFILYSKRFKQGQLVITNILT